MPLTRRQRKAPKDSLPNTLANIGVKPDKHIEKQLNMLFRMKIDDFMKELHTRFTHAELVEVCAKLHDAKEVTAFQKMNKTELVTDVTIMMFDIMNDEKYRFLYSLSSDAVAYLIVFIIHLVFYKVVYPLLKKQFLAKKIPFITGINRFLLLEGITYIAFLFGTSIMAKPIIKLIYVSIVHILQNWKIQQYKPIFRKMLTKKRRP